MDLRRAVHGVAACLAPVAVVPLLAVSMMPAPASAATSPLSSIVITEALPGMVAAPAGPLNGPLTSATIDSSFGGTSGAADALRQAISNGSVDAYIRMWRNEPPNGAFVGVVAAQLPNAADASAALAGADQSAAASQAGHFAVPGIPDATGVTLAINSPAGSVNEDMVMFARGASLFDVVTGQVADSSPGASQLNESDAIQVAQQQAARAPGPPVAPCQCGTESTAYEVGRYLGVAVLIGAVIGLAVYLVRRTRRRPEHQTPPWDGAPTGDGAGGAWGLAPPPPSASGTAPGARTATAVLERSPASAKVDFHCAWCGSGVAVGAGAHDCGSRDRPANYCMRCGSLFADGAATCGSCGSPKLQ